MTVPVVYMNTRVFDEDAGLGNTSPQKGKSTIGGRLEEKIIKNRYDIVYDYNYAIPYDLALINIDEEKRRIDKATEKSLANTAWYKKSKNGAVRDIFLMRQYAGYLNVPQEDFDTFLAEFPSTDWLLKKYPAVEGLLKAYPFVKAALERNDEGTITLMTREYLEESIIPNPDGKPRMNETMIKWLLTSDEGYKLVQNQQNLDMLRCYFRLTASTKKNKDYATFKGIPTIAKIIRKNSKQTAIVGWTDTAQSEDSVRNEPAYQGYDFITEFDGKASCEKMQLGLAEIVMSLRKDGVDLAIINGKIRHKSERVAEFTTIGGGRLNYVEIPEKKEEETADSQNNWLIRDSRQK